MIDVEIARIITIRDRQVYLFPAEITD